MNAEFINSNLSNLYSVLPIFDTIGSTNTYVKEHVDDLKHGSIILAKHQSQGRGRYERLFESKYDSGIYCTFLLKEDLETILPNLSLKIACALHNSINDCYGIETKIKWPNDLLIDSKKCAGILIETHYDMNTNKLNAIVIGWGLNVYPQMFDDSLINVATSLNEHTEIELDRNQLLIHFFNHINHFLEHFDIINEYKKHMIPIGSWVNITINQTKEKVQILDIDLNGQLIIKRQNNTLLTLFNEEIIV
jgi:BirA family biotin operon repressor/biotin-[acetyl-CoA-carboxylase] ligase